MRLALTATATFIVLLFATPASARDDHTQALQRQQARYWHAHGYLWAIHHVAFRTVRSPVPRIRLKWLRAEAWLDRVQADAQAKIRRLTAPALPPHHALWMCIHGHEARDWHNRDTGGNGHFGGLQMHPGWGYGTSYYASDDSQQVQEWSAERGYRASGFSHAWLYGQWAHSDCMAYA